MDRLRHVLKRLGLLLLLAGVILLLARFGRNFGLGELSLILAFFGVVIVMESVRYVVVRFVRGLRGEE